jgi:hypothetical protein
MIPSPDYFIGMLGAANTSLDEIEQPNQFNNFGESIKSLNRVTTELRDQADKLMHQVGEGEAVSLDERDRQKILTAIQAITQKHEQTELSKVAEVAVRQFWTSLKKFEKEVSRIKGVTKVKKVKKRVTKSEKVDTSDR